MNEYEILAKSINHRFMFFCEHSKLLLNIKIPKSMKNARMLNKMIAILNVGK